MKDDQNQPVSNNPDDQPTETPKDEVPTEPVENPVVPSTGGSQPEGPVVEQSTGDEVI